MGGEEPTADGLRELIYSAALPKDNDHNSDVLRGLLKAYIALLDVEDEDFETLHDSNDYEAEKVYREFAIKGWREAVGHKYPEAAASRDDDEVYENCQWYYFEKMVWPDQLIAEVGFLAGYTAGREGIAMHEYIQKQEATKGKDWWKEA